MSGDLRWSLTLPQEPALDTFVPCRIRPDDRFERQLYFESFSQVQPNKVLGILAQAVQSDDGKSVTLRKIFEKNIPTSEELDHLRKNNLIIQFCIDEVASKLYLIFRGIKQDRNGVNPLHLSISPLSFGEPDRFGHRRVTLSGDVGMYKINFGDTVINLCNFFPHPKTGELLFFLLVGKDYLDAYGKLDLNSARTHTVDAQIVAKFDSGMRVPDMGSFRFLDKGRRLAVFSWSTQELVGQPSEPEQSLVQIYSVDGEFKLERGIVCDQLELITNIYQPWNVLELSEHFKASSGMESVCKGIYFFGRTFKYTLMQIDGGLALVKHFHRWFEAGLCHNKAKHCFLSFKTPNIFGGQNVITKCLLGSTLYYTIHTVRDQYTLHRLDLGDRFKDYRTCAYCGLKETNKRYNAQGKRTADFKVCRECKQLNLHHQWWKFPCHYCSDKCLKKGWKEHKKIHRK